MQVPCDACTSCANSEEGYVVGIAAFPYGDTGEWSFPQCIGNGINKINIPFKCCTSPTMTIVDGKTCSGSPYISGITVEPPCSALSWTVIKTNGVSGATDDRSLIFIQNLENKTSETQTVTYSVTPIGPNGCEGQQQLLNVTVYSETTIYTWVNIDKLVCKN